MMAGDQTSRLMMLVGDPGCGCSVSVRDIIMIFFFFSDSMIMNIHDQ